MVYLKAVAAKLGMLVAVVWAAATFNFILPLLAPKNPVLEKLTQLAATSGIDPTRIKELTAAFSQKFGLDRPVPERYLDYLKGIVTFDFGPSIASYPARVIDLIGSALPWTIGLLVSTTVISFLLGTVVGALVAWRRGSAAMQGLISLLTILSAVPFYLVGLVLIYVFGVALGWFPSSGGYSLFSIPSLSWAFALEILYHSVLPALSIVLASIGVWAISMRGMMVTVQGEDYMTFARAKGLTSSRQLVHYAARNAFIPQLTTLALAFGQIVTGAVLVEVVFSYPGMGSLLLESITLFDYPTIYGIVFILILTVATSMLLIDLVAPLLDPRLRVES